MSDDKKRLLIILLATSSIANPFILVILFKSILITAGIIAVVFILLYVGFVSSTQRWFSAYILNFLILISLFLHFETLFRYNFSEYVIENLYVLKDGFFFNKPNLNKTLRDKEYSAHYLTNMQGFRIGFTQFADIELTTCDWLFLGDSFTQAAQVEFEEQFTSILYNKFPDRIIVNGGISGFGIAEEYYFFKNMGRKLKPKIVFLQLCSFNDFMNVGETGRNVSDYLMQYSDLARFLLYGLKFKQPGELPLGRWTEPFYPSEKDNIEYNVFYKNSSEKKNSDLAKFRDYLAKLKSEVKEAGAELIIFLIPTKEQLYFKYFNEVVSNFEIDVNNLDMNYPNRFVAKLADSLGINFIDLINEYSSYSEGIFFEYDEHLNKYGHKVTAEILARHIEELFPNKRIKRLSIDSLGDRYPSYSPDGTEVIFQSFRDGNQELFIADPDFSHIMRHTHNDVDETHPMISEKNASIIFTEGSQKDATTNVVLMNIDGTDRRRITLLTNQFGAIPTFSRAGNLITYAQWYYDEENAAFTLPQIVYCDLLGQNEIKITNNGYENWRPIFTEDDKSIIYISKRSDNFDIFEFNLESGQEAQLTNTPWDEWDPNTSRDHQRIVYAAKKDGNWDLFEMDRRNFVVTQLTFTNGDEWDPAYSPDGTKIIYGGEYGFFRGIYQYCLKERSQ